MSRDTNVLGASTACFLIATFGVIPGTLIIGTMMGLTYEDPGVFLIGIVWFIAWLVAGAYMSNKRDT